MLLVALKLLPVDLILCSGGLYNILYAFGLGYGFSMMTNSALVLYPHATTLMKAGNSTATLALVGGGLYFAYGARLATFLWRRQKSSSYRPKFDDVQQKSEKMPFGARVGITTFVALSQALYSMPLQIACDSSTSGLNSDPSDLAWIAVWVSAMGLVLESIADEQKLSAKANHPKEPVTTGVYCICRHPNYTGEILFHLGMWGLTSQGTVYDQMLAMLAPCFMVWVMLGAAKRLDKEGAEKYKDHSKYKAWRESTSSLFPGVI